MSGPRVPFLVLLAALAPLSNAVVWSDDISDTDVLDFGKDARFSGVGNIGRFGTGTFIGLGNGRSWVITATHVLAPGDQSDFFLPGGAELGIVGRYDMGGDVSVAEIVSNASALSGAYVPTLNLSAIDVSTSVVSAGYGDAGPQSGAPQYSDLLRGFQSRVDSTFFDGANNFVSDRFDAPGESNKRTIEGFGAPGDSGSMFLRESDGAILGVLSNGGAEKYGGYNNYAMLTPDKSREIYRLTGINPVPEPASLIALGLGALAAMRRKSRPA